MGFTKLGEAANSPHASDARARRREAFVSAARDAFFRGGYAGTTMSSIAARVGGSKTTLWSHFPSKEALFAAVVDDIVEHYAPVLSVPLPLDEEVEIVLRRYGEVFLATLLAPPILALLRLVTGEASRFPHLARVFYEKGPELGKSRLLCYFESLMVQGVLERREHPRLAVQHFVGLCQAGRYQLAALGLDHRPPDSREPDSREMEFAIAAFLHFWRAEPRT